MKIFRAFFRSIRDAFKSVIRNFSLSLASVSCITITLIIIAVAFLISMNVKNFTQEVVDDVTVVVFLDNKVTEDQREDFEIELKKIGNIADIKFKSKTAVKEEMINDYDSFSEILSSWSDDDNPLKDTYTIKVTDVNLIKDTATSIEKLDGVYSVQYGEGLVEQLVGLFSIIEKVTIVAAIALTLVTVFLIINTIKLTIFSRKREIGIMRLVGASNTRIKMPFVVEGIILGIIGSIIPICVTIFGYTSLYNYFGGKLFSSIIKLVEPMPFVVYTSCVILAVGMVVGMLGSARAVRRYVKI